MPRPKANGPTQRELEILRILWRVGPSSVRTVMEVINHENKQNSAYTSVLTTMSIMQTKGLLSRNETNKVHIYCSVYTQDEIEQRLIEQFINIVFDGSAMRLVSRALSAKATSVSEAAKIDELLGIVNNYDVPE